MLLQVTTTALLCLALLLCGALAASASALGEERTPVSHGLRKLLKTYKCNTKKQQIFKGKAFKTIEWYWDDPFDAADCCDACKKNSKCWQWSHVRGDDRTGGQYELYFCYLYNGSAKMQKAPRSTKDGFYSWAGKLS